MSETRKRDSTTVTGAELSLELSLNRRQILGAAALGTATLLLPRVSYADTAFELPAQTVKALEKSTLIYLSPLKKDGDESTCHGEVWFMHDQGSVLMMTGTKSWKAKALRSGLDTARIWVGDFGTIKQAGQRYREAPGFKAKASRELDGAAFDRLKRKYSEKYADGWGKWGPRFQEGWDDGSRTLIRYTPISG